MWVVIEKSTMALTGGICFHGQPDDNLEVEIGYGTDEAYQNKGIMTETIAALIRELRLNGKARSVIAETSPDNLPSIKVLEKNNFIEFARTDSSVILKFELK